MKIRPLQHPQDLQYLEELFRRIAQTDGHWPVGEQTRVDLRRQSAAPAHRLVGLVAGRRVAYLHLAPNREEGGWGMELAVDPAHRIDEVVAPLLAAAQGIVKEAGGSGLTLWLFNQKPSPALARAGFVPDRELYQLRRRLPVEEEARFPEGMDVRGFRPGIDDGQWLEVNNLAFAGHPENGNWTRRVFEQRRSADWFDPEGLRTLWAGERLAAFNWTKVHPDGTGEIYVIAVHPDFQGRGLGRAIALEGLAYLHKVRRAPEATLYVDASNRPGLSLYRRLGFTRDHTDRAYRWPVS